MSKDYEGTHGDVGVSVLGLRLETPLMNAAGTCKTVEDAELLLGSAVGAIVIGSITIESRAGNSGSVYYFGDIATLNSLGMPNPGASYWRQRLPAFVRRAHDAGKKVIVSVAGFNAGEYAQLVEAMLRSGADLIELNLGCPNIIVGGTRKPIASFNPSYVREVLDDIWEVVKLDSVKMLAKVSPYSNPDELQAMAALLAHRPFIGGVTTSNTFPSGLAFDVYGNDAINVPDSYGLAGVSGPALKPIALGNVRQFRMHLPATRDVIGVGGVRTGRDLRDYLKTGAAAVQVATAYLGSGSPNPQVFSDILAGFVDL